MNEKSEVEKIREENEHNKWFILRVCEQVEILLRENDELRARAYNVVIGNVSGGA